MCVYLPLPFPPVADMPLERSFGERLLQERCPQQIGRIGWGSSFENITDLVWHLFCESTQLLFFGDFIIMFKAKFCIAERHILETSLSM